jgi:triphosphatase
VKRFARLSPPPPLLPLHLPLSYRFMAKATYEYPADISFKDAARRVLLANFRRLMENAPGTRAGDDIEALHDMRVASRRLRAALAIFGKVFPRDEFRAIKKQVGDITDALGAVRDLDVQMDYLRNLRNTLPDNEAYGINRLIERRNALRENERKALIKALDKMEKDRFERRFLKALDRAVPSANGDSAEEEHATAAAADDAA